MSKKLLIDTDILSNLMKKNERVIKNAHDYLLEHRVFIFSVITKYEILRGLKAKDATKQIEKFLMFCDKCLIFPIDDRIVTLASSIYADLRKKGKIISDADILISSTALVNNFGVVTNNTSHFDYLKDLTLENWLN